MPRAATKKSKEGEVKRKPKKDPNAPKRPLSAYMFYTRDQRDLVRKEHPNATFGEMGKILGEKWRNMDDSQKKPYCDMAEDDRVRYEHDKAAYEVRRRRCKSEMRRKRRTKIRSSSILCLFCTIPHRASPL
ncbi:MAG: high mobility group box domain-containing protein [Olpidium bornovanus]|uniref:High mobility group box domain-containing protein n=1 Tax=Olpidium bornovanus TaxID=278681 RepID=A0A8H7ZPW0_9FUNG|nr:MAG: high mobility group box domain-containing protein [Olpidium bornovanus]